MAWTMGCILNLVKFEQGVYWFFDDTIAVIEGPEDQWVNTHSAYRDRAFEKFCSCEHIIKQYTDKFRQHLHDIGNNATKELEKDVMNNYFSKYSHCQLTINTIKTQRGYEETNKLITAENKCREFIFKD